MCKKSAFFCFLTLPLIFGSVGAQEGQSSEEASNVQQANKYPNVVQDVLTSENSIRYFAGQNSEQRERDQEIGNTAKELRQANSDVERADAKTKLEGLLSDDYDERLDGYEDYLNRLEEKVAEMRRKLQKRRDAKADMIQLRIKVLESEAEDLGWPARMGRSPMQLRTLLESTRNNQRTYDEK